MVLLEVKALACTYPNGNQAVKGLDLSLSEGELVGLIGPDGAGKTTAFRMFMGLKRPTSGSLKLHAPPEQIGYVPQTFSLAPDLTVEENLRLQAGFYGLKDFEPRLKHLLETLELEPFRAPRAGALSGGMKQKLSLCVALLPEPRLLLLDEPTTGVDPVSRREFWDLLHEVHQQGVGILFSSPYMDEAEYAHRMLLLHGDFTAVRDLTFDIQPEEIFGFLGPNGADKSSTIKMLCGVLTPSEGQARALGFDLFTESDRVRAQIGYMSQKFSLLNDLTVIENLTYFGQLYGGQGTALMDAIHQRMQELQLKPLGPLMVRGLSTGEKQRLALAASTLHRPKMLFLDEPTSGVDPLRRRLFWEAMDDLVLNGTGGLHRVHLGRCAEGHAQGVVVKAVSPRRQGGHGGFHRETIDKNNTKGLSRFS